MLLPLSPTNGAWAAFEAALIASGLPTQDLGEAEQHFFALDGDAAFGGYLLAGPDALLRSIVVPTQTRNRGHGRSMVTALLRQLEVQGVERAWLLTTTASPFFERLWFLTADRRTAPAAISATPQFQGVCPSSAAFMCRQLAVPTSNREASA